MIITKKRISTADLLFLAAKKMDLKPVWLTQGGLFAITTNKGERYINHGLSSLNPHVSVGLAKNKQQTRIILGRNGFPNIPFVCPKSTEQAGAFLAEHGAIIVKPLRGSGSKYIYIVSTAEQLAQLDLTDCILERYVKGREMRYLTLNGSVIAVHESKYGESVDPHRYLERISYEKSTWDSELVDLSLKISDVLGLTFSAVDFLIDELGQCYVLEVNSTPGFKWFHAPSEGPAVDVAGQFLSAMLTGAKLTAKIPSPSFVFYTPIPRLSENPAAV